MRTYDGWRVSSKTERIINVPAATVVEKGPDFAVTQRAPGR